MNRYTHINFEFRKLHSDDFIMSLKVPQLSVGRTWWGGRTLSESRCGRATLFTGVRENIFQSCTRIVGFLHFIRVG